MLTPIPLDILLLYARSTLDSGRYITLLVNRINGLQNPDFRQAPSVDPDPRFLRFVEIGTELLKAGILDWIADPRKEVEFDIVISNYAPQYSPKVGEYLGLLGLPMPADQSKDIVLPVYFAVKGSGLKGIAMTTRSTEDLIEILRAAIELPEEHARAGIAINYPPVGLPGQGVRILTSKEKPETASLATKYRGYWFYIEDDNLRTKEYFRAVKIFWFSAISGKAGQVAAPVFTIPVGGR